MKTLIYTFFREKKRFFMSLSVFIVLSLMLTYALENYQFQLSKMEAIQNKEEYRTIKVFLEKEEDLEQVQNHAHVVKIEKEGTFSGFINYTVYIDEEKNRESVVNDLKAQGFEAAVKENGGPELDSYKQLALFYQVFCFVLVAMVVIILFLEIKLLLLWEQKDNALLKIVGYRTKMITGITLTKLLVLLTISNVVALILFLLGNGVMKIPLNKELLGVPFAMVILILLIQIPWLWRKINKIDITDAIED